MSAVYTQILFFRTICNRRMISVTQEFNIPFNRPAADLKLLSKLLRSRTGTRPQLFINLQNPPKLYFIRAEGLIPRRLRRNEGY